MQTTSTKSASPKRKQKIITEQSKEHSKHEATADMPVAPVKELAEEIPLESAQLCQDLVARQQLEESANFFNKIKQLQHILEIDILSCDAKWTLFVAAAFSYRYDDLLRPCPPQFATEQLGFDIDALLTVIKDVPKLCIVLQILIEETYDELSREVIELLYWVLKENSEPVLRLVEGEELNAILNAIDDKQLKNYPTHVFKVNASEGFHCEQLFKTRTQNYPLKLAFMSNKLDSYYSLLQIGLLQNKDRKNYLQLSTDFPTSLQQSPYCAAWGASQCGSIISCTAICEFAFNAEADKITANESDDSCVDICLRSPEFARLRYLIFYGKRLPRNRLPKGRFFAWIYNYRFSFSLLSYMFILLTIGLANSEKGNVFKLFVNRQFDSFVGFCQRFVTKRSSNQWL